VKADDGPHFGRERVQRLAHPGEIAGSVRRVIMEVASPDRRFTALDRVLQAPLPLPPPDPVHRLVADDAKRPRGKVRGILQLAQPAGNRDAGLLNDIG
jgi:hypothetical protein